MAPGVGPLPAAEREVPVAESLARYAADLPPRTVARIRLGLRVFEWLPFPWRFSTASMEAREGFLREMERSTIPWHEDLLLFMKVIAGVHYARDERVRVAVGYEERCGMAPGEPDPEPSGERPSLGDLTPPEGGEDCDVVVIGSGAGGAVAAAVLAEAGLDVVVLEAGPHVTRETYPEDPAEALSLLYRDGGLTVAEGRPAIPVPVGRAVGGTTVVNSGTCLRAPEHVLRSWREELGIGWVAELEAEYSEAEKLMRVMPVDPEHMGRNGQLLMEGARAIGASGGPIPRNAGRCVQCSSCPKGCRLDAKRAMHVTYLPRAVAAGARVRARVEATRVLFEDGRAAGVECRVGLEGAARAGNGTPGEHAIADAAGDRTGRPYEVRARAVVCAAGTFGTPELLLRSGFSNPAGLLGRNLHLHPAAWIGARFDEEVRGWEGVMQSYYVDEWAERGLLLEATFTPLAFGAQWLPGVGREHQERMLAYDRVASTGVHLSDRSVGRVGLASDGSLRITYRLTADEARTLTYGIARGAEMLFAAGAREVYPQVSGNPVIPRGRLADFEASPPRPDQLRLEAFHPMGTAAMGADPGASVTTPEGAVRGAEGLYIADASLLPTSPGVNPMMTVIAFAYRVARALAGRMAG